MSLIWYFAVRPESEIAVDGAMSVLGLIGGPFILLSGFAVLLGAIEAGSVVQGVATIPEFF